MSGTYGFKPYSKRCRSIIPSVDISVIKERYGCRDTLTSGGWCAFDDPSSLPTNSKYDFLGFFVDASTSSILSLFFITGLLFLYIP